MYKLNTVNIIHMKNISRGFTLIELLIVIAVLGILAAVVLIAINPIEQLARGRDAGRKTTLGQLKNGVLAYYTSRQGVFPPETDTWIQDSLVVTGEIRQLPPLQPYTAGGAACADLVTVGRQGNYCYDNNSAVPPNVVVYVQLESSSEDGKCATALDRPYFVFDSVSGVTCLVCAGAAVGLTSGVTCNTAQ